MKPFSVVEVLIAFQLLSKQTTAEIEVVLCAANLFLRSTLSYGHILPLERRRFS
jgi:hypothetical protein